MDSDLVVLTRASKIEKFFEAVLYNDSLDDWTVARDLGELLVRLDGEEIMGHALLARASRHLEDHTRAREELTKCKALVSRQDLPPLQRELFLPVLSEEEKHLTGSSHP